MPSKIEMDEMQEIVADFLIEADELVQSLNTNFSKLSTTPDDIELLNQIFRGAHTIKGIASFLNFEKVTSLTHCMEEVLNRLRKSELSITVGIMDVLYLALDTLKQLLDDVRAGRGEKLDITIPTKRLQTLLPVPIEESVPAETESTETIPVVSELKAIDLPLVNQGPVNTKKVIAEPTIRVDVERLDALMDLLGELVQGRNSLIQTTAALSNRQINAGKIDTLNNVVKSLNFITNELQTAVMKMRMQPVGKLLSRFPRLVRDLARESGKQIELELFGETTELDRSVIEEITDPLIHILRNACHHGIETPEKRIAQGKPAKGTITLSAVHVGSYILIRVEDDGGGFDAEAIRRKVIEREMVAASQAGLLSEKELFRFILEPGFTTAREVTDISGRGVGMDVVRTNIERLNGFIELESVRHQGTTVTLKIPLTLAIMQGLLVETGNETYVLPLSSVNMTVRTSMTNLSYVKGTPSLLLEGEVIPVVDLSALLHGHTLPESPISKAYIVVAQVAGKKLGLAVSRVLGQEEIVVKALGNYIGQVEGVAGATILGDGRVRMIVDLLGIFSRIAKQQ